MNLTDIRATPVFWDRFAPWYERWATRGKYHQPIIREVGRVSEKGWRVLDIGAGTGMLSLPLAAIGCYVDALEPSGGMRQLLTEKATRLNLDPSIQVIGSTWEEFPLQPQVYDLALACNSLHLTYGGIRQGLQKVFELEADYVMLFTEIGRSIFIDFKALHESQDAYEFLFIKTLELDSSFRFEYRSEVDEVCSLLGTEIRTLPCGQTLIQKDRVRAAAVLWEKKTKKG